MKTPPDLKALNVTEKDELILLLLQKNERLVVQCARIAELEKENEALKTSWPRDAVRYFKNHLSMMSYAEYREKHFPIGSGVTEAACKTLIKQRLCRSGMRWKDKGLKTVLSLRSLVLTKDKWKQFWDRIDQYGAVALS